MALVFCTDCKTKISNNAKACPKCGAPNSAAFTGVRISAVIYLGLIGLAFYWLWGLMSPSTPDGQAISQSEYGEKWPFTVAKGSVRCEGASWIVFESGGVAYAVNGSARSVAKSRGWADVETIWRDDPAAQGTGTTWKVSVSPIIERGLKLCER